MRTPVRVGDRDDAKRRCADLDGPAGVHRLGTPAAHSPDIGAAVVATTSGGESAWLALLATSRSIRTKRGGTRNTPTRVAASIPETTAVPSICRAAAPAPVATHRGKQPATKAKDVMRIGRKRSLAPS